MMDYTSWRSFKGLLALTLLVVSMQPLQAQQGVQISNRGLTVDQADQWEQWNRPKHAVVIDSETNSVRPRFVRKSTNAIEDLDQFLVLIGDDKELGKATKIFTRADLPVPLNITDGAASVAGVPIVHQKDKEKDGIKAGDPITWFFYHGGIRAAPNNSETAANILDGDPTTYWEPTTEVSRTDYEDLSSVDQGPIYHFVRNADGQEQRVDQAQYDAASSNNRRIEYHSRSLDNWYIDVDLGRLVPAERIVLHFADEGMGEPFRQFRLLTSASDSHDAPLALAARTITPNETERLVSFDLDKNPDDGIQTFTQIHQLRIAVTDSKLGKFKEVSQEDYFNLALTDQGGIDYFIVNATGTETQVEQAIYNQVSEDRRGGLIYYQRERPRLSGIEVWTQGDNISLGVIEGGGSVGLTGLFTANNGFDGRYESHFRQLVWSPDPRYFNRGIVTLDLGASFWLDVFRMVGGISGDDNMVLRASDGSRDSNNNLVWAEVHRQVGGTFEKALEDPIQVRFLETQIFSDSPGRPGGYNTGDRIREFQLFGQGSPPEVTLTSPVIELPGDFILDNIDWQADLPDPNLVDVQIRTRTGDRLIENTAYYTKGGELVETKAEFDKLPGSFKGPVVTELVPAGWSPWSQRYLNSGAKITSPSPRRYMQIQVQLLSKDPAVAANIRSLNVNFLPPIAHQLVAEIWPNRAPLGQPQDFDLYLNPSFVERQVGGDPSPRFDEILIDAAPIRDIKLVNLSLGTAEQLEDDTTQDFSELAWQADPTTGARNYWFEDVTGVSYQALVDADSGDSLKIFEGSALGAGIGSERLLVRLPRKVDLLQSTDSRVFNRRIIEANQEVPVDEDGRLLNELTYLNLPAEQKGRVIYFEVASTDANGDALEVEVDEFAYQSLADSLKGQIRYFRQLQGIGGEFPFDTDGEPLTQDTYNALPSTQRGSIVAGGEMLRLRFNAEVLLNGTTIDASIRDSADPETWQFVDPGDATPMTPGTNLSISVPFSSRVLHDVTLAPNPFTPNGDGINDQVQIAFSLGNLNVDRTIDLTIYDLSGRLISKQSQMGFGEQDAIWDGRDNAGDLVPPGIYLFKIEVDADASEASRTVEQHLISVAY
jgi:gliding motility-associated-like protein